MRLFIYSDLTQKLCQIVLQLSWETPKSKIILPTGTESYWIEQLINTKIIDNWESQDDPEHLRTIRDRLLHHPQSQRLLKKYQEIIDPETHGQTITDYTLLLSGLIEIKNNQP